MRRKSASNIMFGGIHKFEAKTHDIDAPLS